MKKKGWAGFLRRKQYVIAGALVIIAAIATTVVYSNEQEKERQQLENQLAQEMQQEPEQENLAAVEEESEAAEASSVIPPKNTESTEGTETAAIETDTETTEITQETETEETQARQTGATQQILHFAPEEGILWPMEGNVVLNYSMDATVYFPTLDQYKYNPAIMIEGEVNDKVYSVAKGQISSIENNEVTGCTVTVDLGDGYQAIYGQLKELNFKQGDYVESGHVLGYLNEPTKYFAVEGSNLYFELQKDGAPIDPIEFFE